MLTVACWLWRDEHYRWNNLFRYGPDHVNRLRNMVERHLAMDHEFVCVTDDPEGIDPDIRIVPIWRDRYGLGGCYRRLEAFSLERGLQIGRRFVWFDLDCVIVGDITPLLDRPEPFVAWRPQYGPTPYCGSMMMMDAGAREQVWRDFNPGSSPLEGKKRGYVGTDQAWVSVRIPGEAVWTPEDGIYNFFGHLLPKSRLPGRAARRGYKLNGRPYGSLPDDARIVFFTGPRDPSQPTIQALSPWIVEHWR